MTRVAITNYAVQPQTYTWTVAGVPGSNCTTPTVFSQQGGTVTVGPGALGATPPIGFVLPPGTDNLHCACVQFTIVNNSTGVCLSCPLRVCLPRRDVGVVSDTVGIVTIPASEMRTLRFTASNTGTS